MLEREAVQIADLDRLLHDQFYATLARQRVLASKSADRFDERRTVAAAGFELDEFAVRLAFFFEIAVGRDVAVLQHEYLVAAFLDVAEQMRRQQNACPSAVADLANKRDHPATRRRIEAVGRLVEDDKFRPVHDRLCEFGELLHPERVTVDRPVAGFAEADEKESFVCTFESVISGNARELRHQTHEVNARHFRDERVALRHIPDRRPHLLRIRRDVLPEDASPSPTSAGESRAAYG